MISGILLAAGDSKRMGEPKALLPFDGITFIDSILNKLSKIGCEPIISILGASAELICEKTRVHKFQFFKNPNPEEGQLSSLQIAIEHLPGESDGFIMALVDHPMVKLDTYQKLYEMAKANLANIIIPEFHGQKGHPVYFGRPFFDAILHLPLDDGARVVIRENPSDILYLPVEDEGILKDIDTHKDYEDMMH